MSDAIQQAIEALRMTKYCIPAYGFHAEKVTIDEAIAGLQALQHSGEPVVPDKALAKRTAKRRRQFEALCAQVRDPQADKGFNYEA